LKARQSTGGDVVTLSTRLEGHTSVVRFNGWLFRGLEDAKTVIIETIAEQLLQDRALTAKLKVASQADGFALTGLTGIPYSEMLGDLCDCVEHRVARSTY
jgi:hypothetical protein